MKNIFFTNIKQCIFVVLIMCFSNHLFATHIVGMDLKYAYVSGNTYKIICVVYGDCGPASATSFSKLYAAQPQINIYDGNTNIDCISLTITAPDSGENIAKYVMCPLDTNNTTCTNTSNPYPGVKKFIYTGTYSLPHTSHFWRFIFSGSLGSIGGSAGRAAAITNIASGTTTQLEDTLDNTLYNNTSPNLSLEPILFFCLNNPDTYNPVAVDPDGDSLRFSLISGINGNSNCPVGASPYPAVSYLGGYSASNPLATVPGSFSFDQGTGQINFDPNAIQRSMVVYNIREYRGGVFIGTSQREMNFIVVTCTNTPPTATITGAVNGTIGSDSLHFNVCQNTGTFSFSLNPHEPDTTNKIHVTALSVPTGAVVNITGDSTNAPHVSFSWNTAGVAPGLYTFYLKLQDDYCPVNSENVIAITVSIYAFAPNFTGIDTVCSGSTTLLGASITGGIWYSGNTSVATIGSTTGLAIGLNQGITKIYYTDPASSCKDSVLLTVKPAPLPIVGVNQICIGTSGTLTEAVSGGLWAHSGSTVLLTGTGIITGIAVGIDTVTYTLPSGCFAKKVIAVNPIPVITGFDSVCQGSSITYFATGSGGFWSSVNTSVATIGSTTGIVNGLNVGTSQIFYTDGASGCTTSVVFTVNLAPQPIVGVGQLCVGASAILTDATASGNWHHSGSSVTITPTGAITGLTAGIETISYTLSDGCSAFHFITINPIPTFTGIDSGCTSLSSTLTVSQSGGTWISSNSLIATVTPVGYFTGSILGLSPGIDTITYISASGCSSSIPFVISLSVTTSISIADSPGNLLCYGIPVYFTSTTANGGNTKILDWTVNGTNVAVGDSFSYIPANGDVIKCILTTGYACATPNPDTSNAINMTVIKTTPYFKIKSIYGNNSCIGLLNTYQIDTAVDTGAAPVIEWFVNYTPVATGTTTYTYAPNNGDIITCKITVFLPCANPNPVIVNDTLIVSNYETPGLALDALGGNVVCQGNPISIVPLPIWGGMLPTYYWFLNGVPVGMGDIYTYYPTNGDSVSCIMQSNYPCLIPSDSAMNKIGIVVDPVLDVTVTGHPGQLVTIGKNDTLMAGVANGGISPTYQWLINGVPIAGATSRVFIYNGFSNLDSVTCMVTTGTGTPCQGIQGFNWLILSVCPLSITDINTGITDLQLLPNPNTGSFIVKGNLDNQNEAAIEIRDVTGRLVYYKPITIKDNLLYQKVELNNDLENGIYLLKLISNKGGNILKFTLNR